MKKFSWKIAFLFIILSYVYFPEGLFADDIQENTVFSDNGSVFFQNDEYLIIGILIEDLMEALEIWNIPDSQGFPQLSSITKIKRDEPISIFLAYATHKNEINMTYDYKLLRPNGTFSNN